MAVFDALADSYDATRGGEKLVAEIAGMIERLLDPSPSVVEFGIGTGLVADALVRKGRDVVGIDIAEAMLARAAARGLSKLILADGRTLPMRTASADQVVAVRVFQLVDDPRPLLVELRRILRPGGPLILSPVWQHRPVDAIGQYYWDAGFRQRADAKRLIDHAASVGFRSAEFVEGATRTRMISPNEGADRLERLWNAPVGDDHPLRQLAEPDVKVASDTTYNALVIR